MNFIDKILVVKWKVHRLHILNEPWIFLLFDEPEHAVELACSPKADHEDLKLLNLMHRGKESFKNEKYSE